MQEENVTEIVHQAVVLIQELEGFSSIPYKCPAGVLTIGYGRTYDVHPGDVTTKEDELPSIGGRVEQIVEWLIRLKGHSTLTRNQLVALSSFVYNFNERVYQSSTLCKLVQAGKVSQAKAEFEKWSFIKSASGAKKRSPGLENRRRKEKNLFSTPDSE